MNTQEIQQQYISPKASIWIIGGFTAFAVLCLAYAELPGEWWTKSGYKITGFIAVHAGLELLRAAILTVNVQVLRTAGFWKYIIVLAMTVAATIGIGYSIHYNHAGDWNNSFMWASQVLNFLVLSGELSLSFLLAGRDVDYFKEWTKAIDALNALEGDRQELDEHRQHIDELRRLLDLDREAIEDNRLFIDTLSEQLDKHRKTLGQLQAKDRLAQDQLRLYNKFDRISIDGVKARHCQHCTTINPAPSNKVKEWRCKVCKEMITT